MNEINECPFCGYASAQHSEYYRLGDSPGDTQKFMECNHCGARGPTAQSFTEALEYWNQGPPIKAERT